MTKNVLPSNYVELIKEIATLSPKTRVWNNTIGVELHPIQQSWLQGGTLVYLGCYKVEQNLETGESILWHTFADGPEGYQAQDPDEEIESDGGWPIEDESDHFSQHGIDKLSWSLLNTLDQAVNGFLDDNHVEDFCLGLDADFCMALRHKLIEKLEPLQALNCECGEFARNEISALQKQLHPNN